MKLGELLSEVAIERVEPGPAAAALQLEIHEVRDDSRAVGPGDLFVALPGLTVDGHRFLGEVAGRGAAAVVVQSGHEEAAAAAFPGPRVVVRSSARALARLAAARYGRPASSLTLVGVTGTNGKTTTTYLVESILGAAGAQVGVVGTVNYRYPDRAGAKVVVPSRFTTPTPLELHRVLAEMRDAGVSHVIMEVSSHALELGRLDGVGFRVGAFTNLTQDHLDLHGTMEAYYQAKATLLRRGLGAGGTGVVLVDGEYGERMAGEGDGRRLRVSLLRPEADLHPLAARTTIDGIDATLASPRGPLHLRSPLLGNFNLANIAVAAGIGVALGLSPADIERGVSQLAGVPGRLERVAEGGPGRAILVDYAHTPDALENVIAALRPLTAGRLLCLFGCGGDRDRGKRPRMGQVVAERADLAIVTSDNPRTEDPAAIVEQVVAGVRQAGLPLLPGAAALRLAARGGLVEVDRRRAIFAATAALRPGDVLLLAGKGHEDYQIIGTTRHPFDDRAVAREAVARLADGGPIQET